MELQQELRLQLGSPAQTDFKRLPEKVARDLGKF
jgi:hypothetical protein